MGDETTMTHECTMRQTIDRLKEDVDGIRRELYGNGGKGMKQDIVAMRGKTENIEIKVGMISKLQWVVLGVLLANVAAVVIKAIY